MTFSEGILIVTGDFNYIVDLKLDKAGLNSIFETHTYSKLHALLEKYSLIDCWRHLNPMKGILHTSLHDIVSTQELTSS